MEKKDKIILKLKKGEYSFREMPEMKVLDVKLPLSAVKEIIADFDPTNDRGITAVCGKIEKIDGDPDVFQMTNIRLGSLGSNDGQIDEKAIECTFYQMNNYI